MNRSAIITFAALLILVALNVFTVRMVENEIVWNLQHLLLRGTLVGVCSAVCIWCCRRQMQPAMIAVLITGLAAVIAYLGSKDTNLFSRIWFVALIMQMAVACMSLIMIEGVLRLTNLTFDEPHGNQNETHRRWQISLRSLMSLTAAAAILIASIRWADLNSQSLTHTAIIFAACGILTAINFRAAMQCDMTTASTVTISICLSVAGLLKLTNLDLQQWLTGTLFTISLQTTVLLMTRGRSFVSRQFDRLSQLHERGKVPETTAR